LRSFFYKILCEKYLIFFFFINCSTILALRCLWIFFPGENRRVCDFFLGLGLGGGYLNFLIPTGSGYLKQSTQTNPQFPGTWKTKKNIHNQRTGSSGYWKKHSQSKNRQFRVFEKTFTIKEPAVPGIWEKKQKNQNSSVPGN